MMEPFLAAASALWLGIQTAISPCPLATNIAAVSYVARRTGNLRHVFLAGVLYALGRTLVYVALGMSLAAAPLADSRLSSLLRRHMNEILGPLLIVVAMCLLGLLGSGLRGRGVSQRMQRRVDALGIWGALLLGIVFALAFCPVSAGLFFVALLSLAVKTGSTVALPTIYGLGTALPVLVFAATVAVGAQSLGRAFDRVGQFEWWARQITGCVFLAVGLHYALVYDFGIRPFWGPWIDALVERIWQS
jgi:cytochrome c-type biogenesis protein